CRTCSRGSHYGSAATLWAAREVTPLCLQLGSYIPLTAGAQELAPRRYEDLPVRRRALLPPAGSCVLARSQVTDPLRNGPLPRKSVWTSHSVSVPVESGFGSPAVVSGASGKSGDAARRPARASH